MKTKDILQEALSLPAEQRVQIAEDLLKSLNAPQKDNDKVWASLAEKRWEEIRQKKVKLIDGEEVFKKLWKKAV
ncbi:MAG: addiction module protein [Bacteroidetes bacterium]|nr:addiction module protein [Bacteroidota bacterium]